MVYVPAWLISVVGPTKYIPVAVPIDPKLEGNGPVAVTAHPELG